MSEDGNQFFHRRHPGHNPSARAASSGKTFPFPIEVRHANDPKVIPLGKTVFQKAVIVIAILSAFSFIAIIFFMVGWDDRPNKRDYGALDIAYTIEAVGVISAIWLVTRKTSPVLTITKDGLTHHHYRKGLSGSRTRSSEVVIKWSDIISLEGRQENQRKVLMEILTTSELIIPLKQIWIFSRDPQVPLVVLDVIGLNLQPAEIFQIINRCFQEFGGKSSAAPPLDRIATAAPNTNPEDPIEIRFGKRGAIIYLIYAAINGFFGVGFEWVALFSDQGLLKSGANSDGRLIIMIPIGLLMIGFSLHCLYRGSRSLVNRKPQLIIGVVNLSYPRLALSVPWREIDPSQLKFSSSRNGDFKTGIIGVSFHAASSSPNLTRPSVVLDIGKMDRRPEEIYYLVKTRVLSAQSPTS